MTPAAHGAFPTLPQTPSPLPRPAASIWAQGERGVPAVCYKNNFSEGEKQAVQVIPKTKSSTPEPAALPASARLPKGLIPPEAPPQGPRSYGSSGTGQASPGACQMDTAARRPPERPCLPLGHFVFPCQHPALLPQAPVGPELSPAAPCRCPIPQRWPRFMRKAQSPQPQRGAHRCSALSSGVVLEGSSTWVVFIRKLTAIAMLSVDSMVFLAFLIFFKNFLC